MTAKFKKMEMELCECGHEAPMGFVVYDSDSCATCMPCHIKYMEALIKAEKEKQGTKTKKQKGMTAKEVLRQNAPGFDFGDNENLICVLDAMEEYAALKSRSVSDEEIDDYSREIYPYPSKKSNPEHFSDLQNSVIIGAKWMRDLLKGGEGK